MRHPLRSLRADGPMKRLLSALALLLPLAAAAACDPVVGSEPDAVEIRVYNNSDHTFHDVTVNGQRLGDVPAGEYSRYGRFEEAYRYGAVRTVVLGRPMGVTPIDYVGETPLPPGRYTYLLSADPESGAMLLHFFEGDRLPRGSPPPGAKRVVHVDRRYEGLAAARGADGGVLVGGGRLTLTHVNPTVSERPGSRVIYLPGAIVVTGVRQAVAARLAADGRLLRTVELGEPGVAERSARAAAAAPEGGFLLAGRIERPVTLADGRQAWDMDAWIVRTAADGSVAWSRFLDATRFDFANAVVPTADGGWAVAGQSDHDAWLVKLGAGGETQWTRGFRRAGAAESVAQLPDGGFLLAGDRYGANRLGEGGWVTRTDADGAERWTARFTGSAEAVLGTADGGAVVAGTTLSRTGQMLRIDPAGRIVWQRTPAPGPGPVHALAEAPGGGWLLAGGGFRLTRTDAAGAVLWTRSYARGGGTAPEARAVLPDAGGATLVGTSGDRILVVRVDAAGELVWEREVGER